MTKVWYKFHDFNLNTQYIDHRLVDMIINATAIDDTIFIIVSAGDCVDGR